MQDKKQVLKQELILDNETGEVIQKKHIIKVPKEPEYIKLYLDCLGTFIDNKALDKSLNDMLVSTLKRMTYATDEQLIVLNKYIKQAIAKECNKSIVRLEQAITIWIKEKILIRVGRGVYKVNPYIFGKGDWYDIYNIRATFDFANGTIETVKEYKKKKINIDINQESKS